MNKTRALIVALSLALLTTALAAAPTLLLPSIQVNMRAGKLPPADENGVRYLKIPVRLSA